MKRHSMSFVAGLFIGAAIFGGGAAYAAGVMATPFAEMGQNLTLNGEEIELTGYNINGNNYFKLRDIGEAVGFSVEWNGATRTVEIDTSKDYREEVKEQPASSDSALRHIPKAGDVIDCPDGSKYTITDVSRWDSNVFASGPVGELPTATCDWSRFPQAELPEPEVRRYQKETGDYLFIRNLYETRRMQYTIYNALGSEPDAWRGNEPLATLELKIPADLDLYTEAFWPWRASELTDMVHSRPNSRYYVEAWDYYIDGVFQYTRYCVVSQ